MPSEIEGVLVLARHLCGWLDEDRDIGENIA
jgi:hypothetical protein